MWIMAIVWPVTALWAGPWTLAAWRRLGRCNPEKTFAEAVALAASHCGAGCTLGDLAAEWIHFAAPFRVGGVAMFGAWTIDYALAFAFGIAFQYFTIAPMRHLPPGHGLVQAVKADSLSLTAWQIGMYGFMALMRFGVFGREIPASDPVFWFLMQIAMGCGFLTAYPVNWWLVKKGIKERM